MKTKKNEKIIPKHIISIYIHALKWKQSLFKMMDNGVRTQYNNSGKAASLIAYYGNVEKNDSNKSE